MYDGPGGGLYTGPGGGLYDGPGGGLYAGPGGGLYAGPCQNHYLSNQPPPHVLIDYLKSTHQNQMAEFMIRMGFLNGLYLS